MPEHTLQSPRPKRGFRYKKTASQSDTISHVSPVLWAYDSPEPEGSEMMLHHSAFMIAKRFWKVKQILCDVGKM